MVGAVIAATGFSGVIWTGLVAKVAIPALIAPTLAILVAAVGTFFVAKITKNVRKESQDKSFRWGQIGSASLVSLAHGTNDAQKSMGIILLALIAAGAVPADSSVPFWVILSCAFFMALGTYLGGWRVIRTLGKGLVEIDGRQGMAAETSSAAVILLSSYFGYSLSTTHTATGSILGSGVGMPGAKVRWSVAKKMFMAWLITLPAAAAVGALSFWVIELGGSNVGPWVAVALLIAISAACFIKAQKAPVSSKNVNDDWEQVPPADADQAVATESGAVADSATDPASKADAEAIAAAEEVLAEAVEKNEDAELDEKAVGV